MNKLEAILRLLAMEKTQAELRSEEHCVHSQRSNAQINALEHIIALVKAYQKEYSDDLDTYGN